MIATTLAIARKDFALVLSRNGGFPQALLLGLILIFVFSLSRGAGENTTPQQAATIFWLGTLFCQVLVFHQLHALENDNLAREGLITSGVPLQGIWLGKTLAGLAIVLLAQLVFYAAVVIFLDQWAAFTWLLPLGIIVVDFGACLLGAFMGAIPGEKESLLTVLLFPLLVPQLLAGISLLAITFGAQSPTDSASWLSLGAAYDLLYLGAGLLLFGFFYRGDS